MAIQGQGFLKIRQKSMATRWQKEKLGKFSRGKTLKI
jgi:hypothetical protein